MLAQALAITLDDALSLWGIHPIIHLEIYLACNSALNYAEASGHYFFTPTSHAGV
jgi:hypothetical protein